MANLPRDDVEQALRQKGFREERGRRDTHRWYRLYVDDKRTAVATKVSTGKKYKTLGDPLVSEMAKQLHLRKAEFVEYVGCEIDEDRYRALVAERCDL